MDEPLARAESPEYPQDASRATIHRIQKVLVESAGNNVHGGDVAYEQKLDEAASLDSIAVLEFVTAVEKEFGIELEPEFLEFDFLRDLPALAAYIEERLHESPAPEA